MVNRLNMACFFFFLHLSTFIVFLYSFSFANDEQRIAVSVNGVNISEDDVQRAIDKQISRSFLHRRMEDDKREQLRGQAIDMLIEGELLYQEAKNLGLEIKRSELKEVINKNKESFKSKKDFYRMLVKEGLDEEGYEDNIKRGIMIQRALKQEVEDKSKVSEDDIKNYYENNKNRFVLPAKVRLREIFINVPAVATSDERNGKRKIAKKIHLKAIKGTDFARLAMEFSDDNYKTSGGDIGYVHLNMLEQEVAKAIAHLRQGEVSGIIETIYGYYIFKVEDKQPERQLSFDEVKDRLRNELSLKRMRETKDAFIRGLKAKARIEVYPIKESK